jgi:hypothetical protein
MIRASRLNRMERLGIRKLTAITYQESILIGRDGLKGVMNFV